MKEFFKDKKKFILVVMLLAVMLTGCSTPRGKNGKTYVDSIYTIKDETVRRDQVDIPNDPKLEKKYGSFKGDEMITIPKTTFKTALDKGGWFNGIIVWPIAYLINWVAEFSDAGIGIIAATFLIQLLIFVFSIKQQVATQKMQSIQPEMTKIQAKYAGKKDDRSKMAQAQEMQALYSKYKINPFGTIITTFIQLPVIFGMYQATMKSYAVVTGSFQGINLAHTPIEGFNAGQIAPIVIFVLMVIFQLLSFKMPQWLQERRKKRNHVKEKKYAEPKKKASGMMGSMNMMMYASTAMIAIFAINWPLGMSFYWLISSLARVIQNLVIHKFFMKD